MILTQEQIKELETHLNAGNWQPMRDKYFTGICDCKMPAKLYELLNFNKNGNKK